MIIPHLDQPARLAACLAALAAQSLARESFEVIVVDNGSAAAPEAALAACPGAQLAREPEPGPGPARNRGVALARAPLLAFLDADCRPDPDWLAALLAAFAADPGAGVLGGAVRVERERDGLPGAAEAFDLAFGFRQDWQIARFGFAATANLAVRRAVFEAVGPFGGITIAEDADWGRRAARAGHPTRYLATAAVAHPTRPSMEALRAQWDRHVSHFYEGRRRGAGGRLAWALSVPLVALSPLAGFWHVATTDRLSGPQARAAAALGLVRIRLHRAGRMLRVLAAPGRHGAAAIWRRRG